MAKVGVHCKTTGCEAFLVLRDIPDDTARAMFVPINVGDDTFKLTCPDCGQTHEYHHTERIVAKETA